ncbi:MAG: sodium-translocating pyrophosphatase, partial [Pseudonocardia sp.]|nr:sodium-translocating pyrophosphatase [Pseudonocardia sp.]
GIFTKAADVGADLVGKVEQGIPEDDPRNAATIADNVGDNVGDCAGMAADLFESYAVTLVAALILGTAAFGLQGLLFPLIVPAIGVITAVIGVYITRTRENEGSLTTINRSFYISAVISAVLCAIAAYVYLPASFAGLGGGVAGNGPTDASVVADMAGTDPRLLATVAVIIGIVLAAAILKLTGYYTGTEDKPVQDVGRSSLTGAATVILSGISIGFESAVYTALVISAAVFGAFALATGSITVALFAVALAGTGLLTTVGVIVAMDTFGPVADNAQGIAEMSGDVTGKGVDILTALDAVGNTTKAITKGIAIATAVLAATALFGSYRDAITVALADAQVALADAGTAFAYEVFAPNTLVGVIIGAAVVFMFSGLAINAVTRAAGAIVFEVRRQFKDNPGIMDYSVRPDYSRVVDICTRDSLRELATPGLLAILSPIAVGFGLGVGPLAGFLAGAIASGTLMAIFLANSGGAWDNAKKLVEDGSHGGKGSPAHEATIIGDTVGDPFKDTAGPSINPLLKVMNLVAVLIAPAVVAFSVGDTANPVLSIAISLVAVAIIVGAIVVAKRRSTTISDTPAESTVG